MAQVQLTVEEANKAIEEIIRFGIVEYTEHCIRDSFRKRDVTRMDVQKVLWYGEVKQEGEWNEDYNNWSYKIEGLDRIGEELIAVSIIYVDYNHLKIITVY